MRPVPRRIAASVLRLFAFVLGMICLSLVALHPFLLGALPVSADGALHLHRVAALDHALRGDQLLWARYAPGLVYGYGAPLFNYFPPLSYYPAVGLHRLGSTYLDAWLLSLSAYTLLAGAGMFLLARHWTGSERASWLAAAGYIYAPYLLLDSVARGTSSEYAALAALPFALWSLARLARHGSRGDFVLCLLALALFIPLHTVVALHGAALLVAYCVFLVWRAEERRSVFPRLGGVGMLALLVTAFYWLPALLETGDIKIDLITRQLSHIDIERSLRPLSQVFALPHSADPGQQNAIAPISLGWIQLLLSGAGAALVFRRRFQPMRALTLTCWALVAVLVFMNTPASAGLWAAIPLIGYSQFAWRTLGLASLLLALMTGLGASLIIRALGCGRGASASVAAATLLLIVSAMPWTTALYHDDIDLGGIRDVQRFERESGQLGLSSYREYLPIHADPAQLEAHALAPRYAQTDIIPRLLGSDGLVIRAAEWGGTSARLQLDARAPQTLAFDWLHAPGFGAYVNGARTETFAAAPAGLVAVDIPAGLVELDIVLEATPLQSVSLALGALGLALAVFAFFRLPRARPSAAIPFQPRRLLMVAVIGFLAFGLKTALIDRADTPLRRARFADVAAAPAQANFGHRVDLLAFDSPEVIEQPALDITVYWRLHGARLERDYASAIRLREPGGQVIASADNHAPGDLATRNWLPGAYIADAFTLEIPPFTPALDQPYQLELSLYDSESLTALSVINAVGNPVDAKLDLAPPRLDEAAFRSLNIRPLPPGTDAYATLIEAPRLPDAARAGDVIAFSWAWQKTEAAAADISARILFLQDDAVAAQSPALPLVADYSHDRWRPGEVNRGHHRLIIPPGLPAGETALALALEANGQPVAEPRPLDQVIAVSVPERVFAMPGFAQPSGATWQNGIVLRGYSLEGGGHLKLVWGAAEPLDESLRLFAHALDGDGRIIAQWHGVPVDWTRPTTGWLPGEYVTTRHDFALPAGEYRIVLGWTSPVSGARVAIGGSDFLRLDEPLAVE